MRDYYTKVIGENQMYITTTRGYDNKSVSMTFNCSIQELAAGNVAYNNGAKIQDAFPFLTADEREFLMTGITPSVWLELTGEEARANEADDMKGIKEE